MAADEGPAAERQYGTGETLNWQEEILEVNPDLNALTRTLCDELHATLTAGQPLFVTPHSIRRQIDIMARAQSQGTWPHTGHAIDSREVHA